MVSSRQHAVCILPHFPGCIEHLLFIINFFELHSCLLYSVNITLYFRETLFRVCCMLTVFYFAHIHVVSRIRQKRNAFVYAINTVQAEYICIFTYSLGNPYFVCIQCILEDMYCSYDNLCILFYIILYKT
jgi:hypothetical protein